ncbi:MAG: cytochrome c [Xanthomonadales bacterium]
MVRKVLLATLALALFPVAVAAAGDSPQEARHDLMEDVGGAAKTIGKMLKEEAPFDAAQAMEALQVWADAAEPFGTLFPEGSETGYDTEARSTIWTDRAGFEEALAAFKEKADAAVAANPQTLAELQPAAGPVFKTCKACHESYRVDD